MKISYNEMGKEIRFAARPAEPPMLYRLFYLSGVKAMNPRREQVGRSGLTLSNTNNLRRTSQWAGSAGWNDGTG